MITIYLFILSSSFFSFSLSTFQDGVGVDEKLSLRRVAVVEDFFDIIYSMHVETGPNGEQIRKHAGQKRTYKAVSTKTKQKNKQKNPNNQPTKGKHQSLNA